MSSKPPFRFFLSYSWDNLTPYLQRFFGTLTAYVRDRIGGDAADIAFRDRVTMKAGSSWPAGLFEALRTSQVLVYLLSIDYVKSDYCGREFEAFLSRERTFQRDNPGVRVPLFIQPVIWVPPAVATLPRVIALRQAEDDEFPEGYAKKGLLSLAKQRDATAYDQCIEILGERIIKAADRDRLPPLTDYGSLKAIPDAFIEDRRAEQAAPPGVEISTPSGGPTEVKCVYVAASAQELRALPPADQNTPRADLNCYGNAGWYWQPFNPPLPTTVGSIVQQMLAEYRHDEVSLQDEIDEVLEELQTAADNDQIVLLIVDAWSAFLQRYSSFLSKFDKSVHWNNAVLVPWNDCHEQTKSLRAKLDAQLHLLFRSKYPGPQPSPRFHSNIHSIEEFRTVLLSVLEMIRSEIETQRAAKLQIQGPPIAQIRTSREPPDGR